jgi:cytoskeletal protein RodZ
MADRDNFNDFDDDDQDDGFLTFDARDEEEDRSRGPLVIAAIVAVLAICGVILWQLYAGSRENGDTPQIAADTGSFKAAPTDAGGTATDDLDKGVFDAANGSDAPPLDVQPNTAGAEDPLLGDGGAVPTPAPAVAPVARPAPATPAPAPAPAPRTQVAATQPAPRPVAKPPVAAPAPAPKPVVKPTPAPVQVAQATPRPAPAVATPTPKPAPVVATPAPAPAPKAATAPAPRPSSSGIAAQLGSFQTRASADTALARYRASGLSGPVSVVAADLGEKGTWYRIRATGFDTRAEVDGFCAKARSAGAQCIPTGR